MHATRQERGGPNLITRLMLRTSASRCIDGLWIGNFINDAEPSLLRVEEALNLIKVYDPVRYARLVRDLERIWVTVIAGGPAQFDQSIWACVLDQRLLLNEATAPERIASCIVHEATHARLCRYGIGYEGEELRARVEAVCFRRERAFAAKLPDGEQIRDQANRYLEFYDDRKQWTNEALGTRYEEGAVKALQYLGFPGWWAKMLRPIRFLRLTWNRMIGGSAQS